MGVSKLGKEDFLKLMGLGNRAILEAQGWARKARRRVDRPRPNPKARAYLEYS